MNEVGQESARQEASRQDAVGRFGGPPERNGMLLPALLAVVLVAALFLLQRRLDFTVNEEGFLWYGAVAVGHGEVPLRDFYSYDPGRYYWAAAWMAVAGQGLDGLRTGTSAFAALGLFCGLLAARRAVRNPLALALLAVVLTLWLLPRNKLYEPAIQMAGILTATALIESPTRRRHVAAGAVTGLGLVLGKNHGLYLGVAFLVLIVLLAWRGRERREGEEEDGEPGGAMEASCSSDAGLTGDAGRQRGGQSARHAAGSGFGALPGRLGNLPGRLGVWLAGIALGASPLLLLCAAAPGFARAYLDSFLFFLQQGQTNFPRPVPWPWRFEYGLMDAWATARTFSIGFCFLLTAIVFAAGALALTVRIALAARRREPAATVLRRQPLLAAALVVGLVYTHHAFSRPDLAHLAPSIPALLLLLAALPAAAGDLARQAGDRERPSSSAARMSRQGAKDGLARRQDAARLAPRQDADTDLPPRPATGWPRTVTAATVVLLQPLYQEATTHSFVPASIAGEKLLLRPRIANLVSWVERTATARIPDGATILLAPAMPGLYPILHRRSPVWDVYPIWPAPGALDDRMLEELRDHHVNWAFIEDLAVDGRDELRFRHTHPRTWAYLTANFTLADTANSAHPTQCALLHRLPPLEPATR